MNPWLSLRPWSVLLVLACWLSGCSLFDNSKESKSKKQGASSALLGSSLGARATGPNPEALESLHAVATTHAPAPVRPDPDTLVRNLLLQYREPGSTVAREIGRVEQYRMLLGGANVFFTIVPQEGYDSTSLLAELKVAEEVCEGLVNPNGWEHPGWSTILPAPASDTEANLRFLIQRMLGVPSVRVDSASLVSLQAILDTAKVEGEIRNQSYIPACATIILDAEGLLL